MTESAIAKVSDADLLIGVDGVDLQNFAHAFRFAQWAVKASMAPKGMDPTSVVMALQKGMELGLKPMESLQSITVFNGQAMVRGHLALAMIAESGVCLELPDMGSEQRGLEVGDLTGWCRSHRKGWSAARETTFSMSEAKTAGLTEGRSGMYKKYPGRMLMWRAVGHHCTTYFPDVLRGTRIAEDQNSDRQPVPEVREIRPAGLDPLLASATEPDVTEAEIVEPVTCRQDGCIEDDLVDGWCSTHFPEQESML